jgi:hypothetical protein
MNYYGDILEKYPINCNFLLNKVNEGEIRKAGKVKSDTNSSQDNKSRFLNKKNELKVQDFFVYH